MITQEYDKCNPWLRKNEIVRMFGLNLWFRYQKIFLFFISVNDINIKSISQFLFRTFLGKGIFIFIFFGGGGVVFLRRLTRIKNQKVYKFCCRKSIFILDTNVLLIHVYSDLLVLSWMCFLPLILFQYDIKP